MFSPKVVFAWAASLAASFLLMGADVPPVTTVNITGGDELLKADVFLSNGKYRLGVDVGNFPASQVITCALCSTSALQTTGNTSLSSIDTKTPALGQTTMVGSQPVVIANNQSAIPVSGTITANIGTTNGLQLDATGVKLNVAQAASLGTNTGPMIQGSVTTSSPTYTNGTVNPLSMTTAGHLRVDIAAPKGQTTMSASLPVALASDQSAIPANQGTANTVANGWPFKITDGTNTASVKAASTAPVATDQPLVVVESPNGNHATAANQTTEITNLGNIQTSVQLIDNAVGPVAAGTAGTNSLLIGCVYNSAGIALTNTQQAACQMDKNANIIVTNAPLDGTKTTYSAAVSGFTPASAATDVFVIKGSATKTVRIIHVSLSGTTTSGSGITVNVAAIKRSAADTAGTSTTVTNVPNDSGDAAATAVVQAYTANPTLGTAVGNIRTARVAFPSAGLFAASGMESGYDFGVGPEKAIVLRGIAEQFAINLGATTITGGILSAYVEWTEE